MKNTNILSSKVMGLFMMSCLVGGSFSLVEDANALVLKTADGKKGVDVVVAVASKPKGLTVNVLDLRTFAGVKGLLAKGVRLTGKDNIGGMWLIDGAAKLYKARK